VQRFLYGESTDPPAATYGGSPIRVFRRRDVARVRVSFEDAEEPELFNVAHTDLYFFYDLDIVILALEICGENLTLERAQDMLFRFGRAYPRFWDGNGQAGHCLRRVEWLAADGRALATSDYEKREKYLSFVCRHRAPCIASHWEFLLQPLVPHHSDEPGTLRYRQLEYHRMPLMCYLAIDKLQELTRADYVRLALVAAPGDSNTLPYAGAYLQDFEQRYCYDRFRESRGSSNWTDTRLMCCGHAFVMVGNSRDTYFTDAETGLLSQFRHQYFLLGLIAHMHKAALLMLSDRLVAAVNRLDIRDVESIKRFKRDIRQTLEIFLRFTHRYWFHEVSIQVQARDLFHLWRSHLGTEELYTEVRQEVQDMSDYLNSDGFRRQADTVVRLTVVTIFGLIGTISTGILGMNLFAEADRSAPIKLVIFLVVFVPITLLTLYTVIKSKRLSEFLDALSDERLGVRQKLRVLLKVWRRRPRPPSVP
jgi:hypothetical protein